MQKIIPVLAIAIICVGCANHRNFARVDVDGTFRIASITTSSESEKPHSRVIPKGGLELGQTVVIRQTESQLIFTHATNQVVLDLSDPQVFMRGRSVIYRPYQGAWILVGPAVSRQYDRITSEDDGLTIESKSWEAGLLFFLLPWKEGGTTIVRLEKIDSNHRGAANGSQPIRSETNRRHRRLAPVADLIRYAEERTLSCSTRFIGGLTAS